MKLTDVLIRKAKPKDKSYKLADGNGMYLEIAPAGGKWWRLKYRMNGKERRISLGTYPETSLKQAREAREEARKLLTSGIDPGENRKATKIARTNQNDNSFEVEILESILLPFHLHNKGVLNYSMEDFINTMIKARKLSEFLESLPDKRCIKCNCLLKKLEEL